MAAPLPLSALPKARASSQLRLVPVPDAAPTSAGDSPSILYVHLVRPERFNALDVAMYHEVTAALLFASRCPAVRCVVITGAPPADNAPQQQQRSGRPEYYSSGNDLSVFMQVDLSDEVAKAKLLQEAAEMLSNFILGFVRCSKVCRHISTLSA
jgi:hypothetical protein